MLEFVFILIGVIVIACVYSIGVASARPIPGSGFYKVSRDGRVMVAGGTKVNVLRPVIYPEGLKVKLRGGNRVGEFWVHELVAEAYLPNPGRLTAVRHKDGNVRNNTIANLEWVRQEQDLASPPAQTAL
ncbi:HNH endonuclease [Oxalobacteraceae bacterium OTU3CAMAD1]|jgi:hypothetical protein|nr:HNH endonuclease [Oxalobacteraceae bacterium OTU3CAMAD1]